MNEIAVAVIGFASALIVALIETTRRQNNKDHASNASKLDQVVLGHVRIERKVEDLAEKHLEHIRDHAKGEL